MTDWTAFLMKVFGDSVGTLLIVVVFVTGHVLESRATRKRVVALEDRLAKYRETLYCEKMHEGITNRVDKLEETICGQLETITDTLTEHTKMLFEIASNGKNR